MNDTQTHVFIGLGSNQQNPEMQLQHALLALAKLPDTRLQSVSSLYRNPPFGPIPQPDFVNAVVQMATALSPHELLISLQTIEHAHGRDRTGPRWGPRTLDLDIVLYGEKVINEPDLQIPHPGLSQRNFVLYPLYEIAPELIIPGHGPIANLLRQCSAEGLERIL